MNRRTNHLGVVEQISYKINAYYKTNKVFFFNPCMHVKLFLGTPKTKIGTFQIPR